MTETGTARRVRGVDGCGRSRPRRGAAIGYRTVLCAPRVAPLMAGTLVGRLPAAMAPLAVLIAASGAGYARAGVLSALQALSAAVSQPLLARVADRRGQRTLLAGCTAVTSTAFAALALVGVDAGAAAVLVLLTGAAAPPWQACLTGRFDQLLAPSAHTSAFALDAAATEALYLIAPLLAASLTLASPRAAFAAMAVLGAAGAALVLAAAPAAPGRGPTPGDWLGPLRLAGIRALLPLHLAVGACFGAVSLAAVSLAARCHVPALSGILPACVFAGSMIGALLYGARPSPAKGSAPHLLRLTTALTAAWLLLPALEDSALGAAAAALSAGTCIAPLLTCGRMLASRIAPTGSRSEAAGWLIAALGVGEAAGTVAAACMLRVLSAAYCPLACAALSLALLLPRYRRIRRAACPPPPASPALEPAPDEQRTLTTASA